MTPTSAGTSFPEETLSRRRAWLCAVSVALEAALRKRPPPPLEFFLSARQGRGFVLPQQGFTLLEILLVLSIIGLAGVLLVPRLGDLDSRGFNVEVREAASLLNHARRNAIVTGNPATVSFVPETGIEPFDYRPPFFSAGVFAAGNIEMQFLDSAGQREPVREPLEISFFPEGGSTGGTLLLSRDDRGASITVDPVTGRLETIHDAQIPR